jgi:hypothetical protein
MKDKAPDIRILTVREQKVVLDSDLAAVYGVRRNGSMNNCVAIANASPQILRSNSAPKNMNL